MLPEHLSSSYDKYKRDTKFFLTWLAKNAKACGYQCPPPLSSSQSTAPVSSAPSTSRLKGKARKEAKLKAAVKSPSTTTVPVSTKKHVLSTKELLIQAKVVANSTAPLINVPEIVQKILSEAISVRKRCNAWFYKMNGDGQSAEDDESNSSHEYFILVLEKAFELLKPRFETPQKSDDENDSENNDQIGISSENTANQFTGLEVEDIDELIYDTMPSATPATPAESSSKSTELVYELEAAETAELEFNVFCFFEDLNRLREFLRRVWESVALEKLDYMSASLTSNIALELVRKEEVKISELASHRFDDDPYRAATSLIHPVSQLKMQTEEAKLEKVAELEARMAASCNGQFFRPSPSAGKAEFVFLSTFYTLWKVAHMTRFVKKHPSVPAIGRLYLFNENVCPGNPDWMYEDDLLSKMLLDLEFKSIPDHVKAQAMKASRAGWLPKREQHPRILPVLDEITNGLQDAILHQKITISAVFQARILLDIAVILGERNPDYYLNLRQIAATADSTLGIAWTRDKKILKLRAGCVPTRQQLTESWVRGNVGQHAMQTSFSIRTNIRENVRVSCKMSILNEYPLEERELPIWEQIAFEFAGMRLYDIEPSGDPTFYFNYHALYCGMERLRLEVSLQKLGLSFANASCSVATVAHLYNACRQQDLLNCNWHQMEEFIACNIRSLFKGEVPVTTKQIINRFGLSLKIPVTVIAGFRPGGGPSKHTLGQRALKNADKMLNLPDFWDILDEYFDTNGSGEKLLFDILKLAKTSNKDTTMTAFELLPQFLSYIHGAVHGVDVDMITLTRNCNALLVKIREEFMKQFGIPHLKKGEDIAKYTPEANVNTVSQIFHEEKWLDKCGGRQNPSTTGEKRLRKLEVAAKLIENFIPEANTSMKVKPFDVIASSAVGDAKERFSEKELESGKRL